MIARQTTPLEVYRGDSVYKEVVVLDEDDNPVDVTGATFRSEVRAHVDGPIIDVLYVKAVDATTGLLSVYQDASTTEAWDLGPDGTGVWDLEVTTDDATPLVVTSHRGVVTWIEDVTV